MKRSLGSRDYASQNSSTMSYKKRTTLNSGWRRGRGRPRKRSRNHAIIATIPPPDNQIFVNRQERLDMAKSNELLSEANGGFLRENIDPILAIKRSDIRGNGV